MPAHLQPIAEAWAVQGEDAEMAGLIHDILEDTIRRPTTPSARACPRMRSPGRVGEQAPGRVLLPVNRACSFRPVGPPRQAHGQRPKPREQRGTGPHRPRDGCASMREVRARPGAAPRVGVERINVGACLDSPPASVSTDQEPVPTYFCESEPRPTAAIPAAVTAAPPATTEAFLPNSVPAV